MNEGVWSMLTLEN